MKKIRWITGLAITLSSLNTNAFEVDNLVGCWQNQSKANAELLCLDRENKLYVNLPKFSLHGTWQVKHNELSVSLMGEEKSWGKFSLESNTLRFTTGDLVLQRVKHQPPLTPPPEVKSTTNNAKVAQDIGVLLTEKQLKHFSLLNEDLLAKGSFCHNEQKAELYPTIKNYLNTKKVIASEQLVDSFFNVICQAKQNSYSSKVNLPYAIKSHRGFYSGTKKLGDWSCESSDELVKKISFASTFATVAQASRWHKVSANHVDIWLASFEVAPSDAEKFSLRYKNNQWKLESVCYSMRL
ncbi:hypothetical protein [Thalassotalea ganghwensis]